jgi:hypothetical protein
MHLPIAARLRLILSQGEEAASAATEEAGAMARAAPPVPPIIAVPAGELTHISRAPCAQTELPA